MIRNLAILIKTLFYVVLKTCNMIEINVLATLEKKKFKICSESLYLLYELIKSVIMDI